MIVLTLALMKTRVADETGAKEDFKGNSSSLSLTLTFLISPIKHKTNIRSPTRYDDFSHEAAFMLKSRLAQVILKDLNE